MPNINIAIQLEYAFYFVVSIFCVFLFVIGYSSVSAWQCHEQKRNNHVTDVRYKIVGGCQLKVNNEWISENKQNEIKEK